MSYTIVDAFVDVYMNFLVCFEQGGGGNSDPALDYLVGLLFRGDDWLDLTIMTVGNQWFWFQNDQIKRSLVKAFVLDVLEHEDCPVNDCAVAA